MMDYEVLNVRSIDSGREFAREKLPAIAEELTSGPWTEGASRFLDWVITQAEGQNDASEQNR